MSEFAASFQSLLDARFPLLTSETHEETRLLGQVATLCTTRGVPLFVWSLADGLKRHGERSAVYNTNAFTDALRHVDDTPQNGLYVFLDAHPFFSEPLNVRLIREIAFDHYRHDRTLLFVSPALTLPAELARMAARLELPRLDAARVRTLLKEEIERWQRETSKLPGIDPAILPLLVQHLAGLGEDEVRRLLRQSIQSDGELNARDLRRIATFKRDRDAGALEMELPEATLAALGGFARLKAWIAQRERVFLNPATAPQLPPPRGVLLLGVQGAGKSLAAKAIAGSWKVPLLRLDFASLFNKYIGETEKNLRQALAEAERMAPCVLWMDEIEKGLAAGDADDGTARRIQGTLLTWMSERDAPVFMVATANDVSRLPPELLRKGRFDELFFVDLPAPAIRESIFAIHLHKRGLDPAGFDLAVLAEASAGCSGAEIEQAVIAAHYAALAGSTAVGQAHVAHELAQTRPLSVIRAEDFERLRAWANARCVMVD